jgi:hypothetical protein
MGAARAGKQELRKYTVLLPKAVVDDVMAKTGKGLTLVLREALQRMQRAEAQKELLKWFGKYRFRLDANAMRDHDDR